MTDFLLEKTLELLRASQQAMPEIARATGVKLRWLHRLKAGDFEDPGVTKIERLYRYLIGSAPPDRTTADGPGAAGGAICHEQQPADAGHRRDTKNNDGECGEDVDAAA